MDNFTDKRDDALLDGDRYTFFVLRRVMKDKCRLLLTDHERLIICHTDVPHPVWIWTPDGAPQEEKERAYRLAEEKGFLDGEHFFNMKYDLAEYFIERAAIDGVELGIKMNLFAYDCPAPIKPDIPAEGGLFHCTPSDTDEVTEFVTAFRRAVSPEQADDAERARADAAKFIEDGYMYFWKTSEGESAACCKYATDGGLASVNFVYTRPEFRRKHIAQNMVYAVTKLADDAGYTPMLYTDADYAASNACYEKIGYILRGKLCEVG